jgi:putative SOS response-associated peptidase YedK
MCGRYTLATPLEAIFATFNVGETGAVPFVRPYVPRYNIAPTQLVLAVRQPAGGGERELAELKWGLIPSWSKDEKIAYSTINARAETVADKPAFRSAFKQRRCLVVADGWYEWKAMGPKSKQPYRMHYADDRPFGMAGLWESWKHDGRTIESCTIIVTAAAPHLTSIHDRSPCIVRPTDYAAWLDPEFESRPALEAMLTPPDESVTEYPVSAAVGNVKNQGPELVKPVKA